jgi:hypothetical protein
MGSTLRTRRASAIAILKPANILLTKQGIKEAGKTSGSRCPFSEQELASQTHELDYH